MNSLVVTARLHGKNLRRSISLAKTGSSYIKPKKDFANSALGGVSSPPGECWLSKLESLRTKMNAIYIPNNSDMTEVDLMYLTFQRNMRWR